MAEKTVDVYAKYEFSKKELDAIAEDMALKIAEVKDLKEVQKNANAEFKNQIDQLNTRVTELAEAYNNKGEYRNIACLLKLDFENNKRIFTSEETGEVIKEEEMKPEDRQTDIEDNDETPF